MSREQNVLSKLPKSSKVFVKSHFFDRAHVNIRKVLLSNNANIRPYDTSAPCANNYHYRVTSSQLEHSNSRTITEKIVYAATQKNAPKETSRHAGDVVK